MGKRVSRQDDMFYMTMIICSVLVCIAMSFCVPAFMTKGFRSGMREPFTPVNFGLQYRELMGNSDGASVDDRKEIPDIVKAVKDLPTPISAPVTSDAKPVEKPAMPQADADDHKKDTVINYFPDNLQEISESELKSSVSSSVVLSEYLAEDYEDFKPLQQHAAECTKDRCYPALVGLGRAGFEFVKSQAKMSLSDDPESKPRALTAWWLSPMAWGGETFDTFAFETETAASLRKIGQFELGTLVHIVRFPLAHLASMEHGFNRLGKLENSKYLANDDAAYRFVAQQIGYDVNAFMALTREVRSVIAYVEWNERLEKVAHYRVRAEALNGKTLVTAWGMPGLHMGTKPMKSRGFACKTWEHVKYYAPEEYFTRLQQMTERYGYKITDTYECGV